MKRRFSHKFRFQIMADWLLSTYPANKCTDIGGGNGLLAFLLNKSGWNCTVIDPSKDRLVEWKYKDLNTGKQIKLTQTERASVPRIELPFTPELAKDFSLLIGLHAHGSNLNIINSAKEYSLDFAILPCCVIDEPIDKQPGINWFNSLFSHAQKLNLSPQIASLPFVGQAQVIYTQNHLLK